MRATSLAQLLCDPIWTRSLVLVVNDRVRHIRARALSLSHTHTHTDLASIDRVGTLKERVVASEHVEASCLRLFFCGRALPDDLLFAQTGAEDLDMFQVSFFSDMLRGQT